MNGLTRGSAAIVGAAESDIGAVAALMSPIDLMAQGIHRALADAGIGLSEVDGLFSATTQARTSAMSLVEYLGLPDAYTDSTIVGGSSFEIHVAHAKNARVPAHAKVQRRVDWGTCHAALFVRRAWQQVHRPCVRKMATGR